MKRNHAAAQALTGLAAAGLLLTTAGCSSDQKPAALGTAGAGATSAPTTSAASSSPTPSATSSSAVSSASSSSAAAPSSPAAPAPTTVVASSNGWTYKASVPGNTDIADALKAFQTYRTIIFHMNTTADYAKGLIDVADGNVLTLANNYLQSLKKMNLIEAGPLSDSVTVSKSDLSASPPLVTIVECRDTSKYGPVYASGAKKGQAYGDRITHPYPATFKIHKSPDGKWRVTDVQSESDKKC